MAKRPQPVGIDDMAFYVPKLFLNIRDLAEKRGIVPEKLTKGLGLEKMALPDAHEDAATMAAEAIFELFEKNPALDPRSVGRIFLGTESALDAAKPTATYAMAMVADRLEKTWGKGVFRNCDALDMTFACAGAVDALQICLDWVRADRERTAIVVASDLAKYELNSSGEYTQGAGAVAMLLRWEPNLLIINDLWGTSTESVHDFFKPRRRFSKHSLVAEALETAGHFNGQVEKSLSKLEAGEWFSPLKNGEPTVEIFRETPVFDGQFSNACYQNRMTEALADWRERAVRKGVFSDEKFRATSDRWARMAFHLPYSFHAKRIFVEEFVAEKKRAEKWAAIAATISSEEPRATDFSEKKAFERAKTVWLKAVSESASYQKFVSEKLEKAQRASSEVGNMYTASIFLALLSTLESDFLAGEKLAGKRIGFVAYGSGSKSKIFEAVVSKNWAEKAARFDVFKKIEDRRAVSYDEYEALHTGRQTCSIAPEAGRFGLERIGEEGVLMGARFYETI